MESTIYNQKGQEAGKVKLPKSVFGVKWNPDLVHQTAFSMASSARAGTAHTKNRGEVRGGGRKPWQQKGTGRARHGSIRSPLWSGGGVSHGPRSEKNYNRKVNKKMKKAAFYSVLSKKLRENEIFFLDFIALPEIKTKEAHAILSNLAGVPGLGGFLKKKTNAAYIATQTKQPVVEKSFRNIGNVAVGEARNLNVLDVLKYKYIILAGPEESLRLISRNS